MVDIARSNDLHASFILVVDIACSHIECHVPTIFIQVVGITSSHDFHRSPAGGSEQPPIKAALCRKHDDGLHAVKVLLQRKSKSPSLYNA